MSTYLTILIALFASSLLFDRTSFAKPVAAIWILFLCLFIGTRDTVGCDFFGYLNRFVQYAVEDPWRALEKGEPAFTLINYFVLYLDLPYPWVNFFAAVIYTSCLASFVLRRDRPILLLMMFFGILIIQLGMSGIRQGLAMAILLLAFDAFIDKRRIACVVWVLVAGQFHTSALIFLFLPLISGRQVGATSLAVYGALAAPVVLFLAGERVDIYNDRYIEGDAESGGALFRISIIIVVFAIFEYFRPVLIDVARKDYQFIRLFSILAFLLIPTFIMSSLLAHRLAYYIMPAQIVTLEWLAATLFMKRGQAVASFLVFSLYAVYMVGWFSLSRHANICYVPYNSYLF